MFNDDLSFDGFETSKFEKPRLKDYGYGSSWDSLNHHQQEDVEDHYLINKGSHDPPADFGSLSLPVVDPGTNKLNKHAVDNSS